MNHLVISDTQVKPGLSNFNHLDAAVNFALTHEPQRIIMIGDWWDMPSLNSYGNAREIEGRRVLADIEAGNDKMADFVRGLTSEKGYTPELDFFMGNHEHRLERFIAENPKIDGIVGARNFNLSGWKVSSYLKPKKLDGVTYAHYFINPMTGKPIGGAVSSMLKNLGYSFVQGHKQCLDFHRLDRTNGTVVQGLVTGAFYQHDEDYKGPQGNSHWRGICHLQDVRGGAYDLEMVSMKRLLKEYL